MGTEQLWLPHVPRWSKVVREAYDRIAQRDRELLARLAKTEREER